MKADMADRIHHTGELKRLIAKLEEELLMGLQHGFFELSVCCEVLHGKRRVLLKAGRSYRFNIQQEELAGQ